VLQLATWYVTTILVESWMKQVWYKKASQMSICEPLEGIFWPMGLFQFLCQKKREARKRMINLSWEPHQVTKQKEFDYKQRSLLNNFWE